jgi:Spy/CpxP family protein refolding chaperone
MNLSKKFAMVLTIVIGLALTSTANAQFGHGRMAGGMGPGFPGLKMVMHLDLSDAQRDEIRTIIKKYRAEGQEIREDLASVRENMASVMFADQLDEAAVRSQFKVLAPQMEDLAVLGARIISEVKTVLTPDQIETMKEMRSERMGKQRRFRKCQQASTTE